MVIRGNDLDELDAGGALEGADADAGEEARGGPMRCLQIDLRQFGLGTPYVSRITSLR